MREAIGRIEIMGKEAIQLQADLADRQRTIDELHAELRVRRTFSPRGDSFPVTARWPRLPVHFPGSGWDAANRASLDPLLLLSLA